MRLAGKNRLEVEKPEKNKGRKSVAATLHCTWRAKEEKHTAIVSERSVCEGN